MLIQIKHLSLVVLAGIVVGFLWQMSPGAFFILSLTTFLGLAIWKFSNPEERKFLVGIFIIGLGLRMAISSLTYLICAYLNKGYHIYGYDSFCIFGDSAFYSLRGWLVAQDWMGKLDRSTVDYGLIFGDKESYNFYIYALFHYLFGYSQLAAKFINSIFGGLTPIFIYYIVKDIFNKISIARIATVLLMFFPSLFLWSTTNLKEPMSIFLVTLVLWSMVKSLSYFKIRYFCISILAIASLYFFRRYPLFFTLLPLFFCLLFWAKIKLKKTIATIFLCVIVLIFLFQHSQYIIKGKNVLISTINYMEKLVIFQVGQTDATGSGYKIYPERFYLTSSNASPLKPLEFTYAFIKSWIYFMFAPFPWVITTKLQLVSYFQIILWYILILFSIQGILIGLRYNLKKVLILISYLFLTSSFLALASGNIGTMLRHRDMVTPFYLIFSAVGINQIFIKKDVSQN